ITYYDDYDFDFDGTPDYFYSSISPNENARNFVTGVKTRVLGSLNFLLTLTFYDTYGREVETRAEHLHGIDLTKYSLNFIGEIEGNNTLHNGPSATTIDQTREYCYDHNGRPLRITSQVNTDQRIVLAAYEYDVLGRQKTKKLHSKDGTSFIQGIDYSYNIRDWMTSINPIKASTDLFSMKLFYNEGLLTGHHNAAPSFNGNITGMIWETELDTEEHGYSFAYDQMNRLKSSVYASGSAMTNNTGRYDVSFSYDKNGNIKTLDRYGKATSGYGLMDDLDYTYDGNRLDRVEETSTSSAPVEQFIDGTHSGTDYLYDFNGNVKEDKNKGIITNYNHLNKPTLITKGSNTITYVYDAAGTKLQQIVSDGSTKTNDYINGVHYSDNIIQFIQHEEGRLVPDGTIAEYRYEYHLTDHLGNARVTFSDMNDDGVLNMTTDVLQTDHYYPFGMRMSLDAAVSSTATPENQYLYNGKELQTDLDLDWYDYGARMYDASIARWNGVDPRAEKYLTHSPLVYVYNNPMAFIDPTGEEGVITINKEEGTITVQAKFYYDSSDPNFDRKYITKERPYMVNQPWPAYINADNEGWESSSGVTVIDDDGNEWTVSYEIEVIGLENEEAVDEMLATDPTANKLALSTKGLNRYEPSKRTLTLNINRTGADKFGKTWTHEVGHSLGLTEATAVPESGDFFKTDERNGIVLGGKGYNGNDKKNGPIMSYAKSRKIYPYEHKLIVNDAINLSRNVNKNSVQY
ncbi:MAG: RHS repeat-associated core domain-containing protein, partial [Bacteroidota bacterium]